MLYELRTIGRGKGNLRDLSSLVGEGRPGGVFQTEVGEMGQIVMIRPFEPEPAAVGSGARPDGRRGGSNQVYGQIELLEPAPFMRPLEAQQLGNVWELRWVDYPPYAVEAAVDWYCRWMPHREEYSPVVGCWKVQAGPSRGRLYFLLPYRDWDHRDEIRARLRTDPAWPPKTGVPPTHGGSILMLPAPFSPLH
jgi:NIPSNAP